MKHARGFTLIELMLSMSFVSILLISIAMLSIQLSNQYSRGLTLKEVTQAGTEASNDIKRTMSQAQITTTGVRLKQVVNGGWALCTGSYTYIANSPANLEANNAYVIRVGEGANKVPARLTKVRDLGGALCSASSQLDSAGGKNLDVTDASELLSGGSRLLVVRALTLSPDSPTGLPAVGQPFYDEFQKGRGIYTITITIGTGVDSEIQSNTTCKAPGSADKLANLDFCAIDTFEFTTRVGSSKI